MTMRVRVVALPPPPPPPVYPVARMNINGYTADVVIEPNKAANNFAIVARFVFSAEALAKHVLKGWTEESE